MKARGPVWGEIKLQQLVRGRYDIVTCRKSLLFLVSNENVDGRFQCRYGRRTRCAPNSIPDHRCGEQITQATLFNTACQSRGIPTIGSPSQHTCPSIDLLPFLHKNPFTSTIQTTPSSLQLSPLRNLRSRLTLIRLHRMQHNLINPLRRIT